MVYFGTEDGQIIGKLGEVSEVELTCGDTEPIKLNTEPIEMECKWDCDPFRAFLPQGMYNAYVLKRDGYLSPKNGWFTPEKVDKYFKEIRERVEENLV